MIQITKKKEEGELKEILGLKEDLIRRIESVYGNVVNLRKREFPRTP